MASARKSAIRLSAPVVGTFVVIILAVALLIGKRLDAVWAGGGGAGAQHNAILLNSLGSASLPQTLARGESITTNADTFAAYTLNNECTVYLAENSSLFLEDGRARYNVFNLLTGRAVAVGDCTFITRETEVSISGTATLIHFSWLNELIVKSFSESAVVSQSGSTVTLTPENGALRFFTLPSESRFESADFSIDENNATTAFYSWSISP